MSETSKSDAPGVVVIGRDEGARLERCLRSLQKCDATVVYVDSGSSDGSLERAREAGVQVVELDMSRPFCAARARNAGFDRLCERRPGISWVQFVDGDCELDEHWLKRATSYLEEHEGVAIVCGRLREREPDRSVYNRLCDIEWDGAIGEIDACGGIFMVRAQAFSDAGRFNETIAVGEEPDLCWRLRRSGWSIVRCDRFMAWHDAALTRFSQWWRREVRNGYGHLDLARRFGFAADAPYTDAVRSARIWGIGLPLAVISVFSLVSLASGATMGFLVALPGLAIWPAQVLRVAVRLSHAKDSISHRSALRYGFYTMLAKWPHLMGHLRRKRKTALHDGVHFRSDAGNANQDGDQR
ncbi:MAG: glycosyltransferase family 2 protein [bacterium]|nr:glycosyltransferase family 2 protein [bacterium]